MPTFSEQQFFDAFARYNAAIWPAQIGAYLLGGLALGGALLKSGAGAKAALALVALLWAWTGVVYHGLFFADINPAGPAFAALFVVQAIILFYFAARSSFCFRCAGASQATGLAMIAYAALIYPLLNAWSGHAYPRAPSFGVTPCPLVIFTFGMLLLTRWRAPWALFLGPALWSVIGGSAAFLLGVMQDAALPVAAAIAVGFNARKRSIPA